MLFRILVSIISFISLTAAAQPFTLACKGGPMTSFHWSASQVPWSAGQVKIVFFKAATGHNNAAVGPNQCAWLDRRVRHNEPGTVCVPNVGIRSFSYERQGKILATHYAANREARTVLQSDFWSGRTFFLQVFNNGKGCLEFVRRGR